MPRFLLSSLVLVLLAAPASTRPLVREDAPASYDVAAFSRGGRVLASLGESRNRVRVEYPGDGRAARSLVGHEAWVSALALSRDGTRLASGDREGVILTRDLGWEGATRRLLWHQAPVRALALSPGGRVLASLGDPERGIAMWDVVTGRRLNVLLAPGPGVRCLAFSPDGRTLVGGAPGEVHVFDVWRGHRLRSLPVPGPAPEAVRVSPDGRLVATSAAGGEVRVHELEGGALVAAVPAAAAGAACLGFTTRGERLAIPGPPGYVRIHELPSGRLLHEERVPAPRLAALEFLPAGREVRWAGEEYHGVIGRGGRRGPPELRLIRDQ